MVKAILGTSLFKKKFKPWRKGKSTKRKPNGGSSLKQQLRGKERLLLKTTDPTHQQALQQEIQQLKAQIDESSKARAEREHAKKSHGTRFLERQRLCRMLRAASTTSERTKIALDQVYVAHYPLETRYLALFKKGERRVDDSRNLKKRAALRKRILVDLQQEATNRVPWISQEQYDLVMKIANETTWSVERERETWGETKESESSKVVEPTSSSLQDDRFALSDEKVSKILQAADTVEAQLEETIHESAGADSSSSSKSSADEEDSEDDDKPDQQMAEITRATEESRDSSSGDSDSDSDDSSSSDSSSSDDSDEDDGNDKKDSQRKKEEVTTKIGHAKRNDAEEEEDDFFVDASNQNNEDVFKNAKHDHHTNARGDKSKGWETQRQRPGQFKRRKVRR